MIKQLKFTTNSEEFNNFLGIIEELNKIPVTAPQTNTHKFKIMKDTMMAYSVRSEGQTKINAVKIFILNNNDVFTNLSSSLDNVKVSNNDDPSHPTIYLTYVMIQADNWVKQFKVLGEDKEDIEITLNYEDSSNAVYSFEAKNSILSISATAGELNEVKDLPLPFVKQKMNPKVANWSVTLTEDLFKRIKKLSKLNVSKLLSIRSNNNDVLIKDNTWELKLPTTSDVPDGIWKFKKEYLDVVTLADQLELCLFDTYILIKEKNSLFLFNLDLVD